LKSYVDYLQAVLSSKNLDNMTSSQLMEKAMRDTQIRDFLTDTGIHNLMLNDFQEATTRIVSLQEQIDTIGENTAQAAKKKALIDEQKTLIDRVEKLMNGEGAAEYVQMSLAYAIPAIRDNLVPISKYTWTKANYGKLYHELPDTGVGITKAFVDAEYKKFTESTDKKQYLR
jgi:seryl-tRNA synthetase